MISTPTVRAFLIGTPDVELSVSGGTITLDAREAPHVTAELTVDTGGWVETLVEYPDDIGLGYGEGEYGVMGYGGYATVPEWDPGVDTLLALDPRLDARVRIEVETITPLGIQSRSFDLGLRTRPIEYLESRLALTLGSDEGLLRDWFPLADDTAPLALAGSLRDIVDYVLDAAIPGASLEASPAIDADLTPAPGGSVDDAFTWRAGQPAIDFLQPLVQVNGYRLVCDEQRQWTLRDENYRAEGSTAIRHAVNMHDAGETIDRDSGNWFDAAAKIHTWTDSLGVEQVGVDAFALTTPYTRGQRFESTTPYPGPGFAEYAVRRAQQAGREVRAVCATDWRANAEQSVTIVLDAAPTQTGLIDSVEFSLDNNQMTVSTRTLDTIDAAWLLIPEDETWLDQPLGESWLDEVI